MLDRIAWLILALIHLMPALAFFRPAMLTRLYAVEAQSPTFLLLHHRARAFRRLGRQRLAYRRHHVVFFHITGLRHQRDGGELVL